MTEAQIQASIVLWLRTVLPDAIVHHSPNEGVRGGKAGVLDGARKKRFGQIKGFPDIEVITWSHIGPMYFEVKSLTGRVSPEQAEVMQKLIGFGYKVAVVQSIDQVRAALFEWGIPTREANSAVKLQVRGVIR